MSKKKEAAETLRSKKWMVLGYNLNRLQWNMPVTDG